MPVKTGSEANPNGRPKSEASRLRSEMRDAFCLHTYPKFTDLVDGIHALALEGKDLNAYRMIFDFCLGRPFVQKEPDEPAESVNIFVTLLVSQLQAYGDKIPYDMIQLFKDAVMKASELSQIKELSAQSVSIDSKESADECG